MWIWPFRRVDTAVVFVLCTELWFSWESTCQISCISGFDFWSHGHLRMAMVHLHIKFGAGIIMQSGVIVIFPKFKMAAAAILDFQIMWIWPFRRVDSVVFVFCTKFGSYIYYSHWDRRMYASDFHLMTSRELTSGFKFWSRGHIRMVAMHLPIKFGADIFIWSRVIGIFPKLKMAAAAILDLLGEPWDHPWRHTRCACFLQKFRHDWLSSFQVIRVWIFCRSGLKVLFMPQKWGT